VRHWRIDQTHSNAFTVWRAMGRPQHPTPEQLAELKRRQGLEEGDPVSTETAADDILVMQVPLPLHALSLLELSAES
jgi:xylan 1,4-beta-xylosidase